MKGKEEEEKKLTLHVYLIRCSLGPPLFRVAALCYSVSSVLCSFMLHWLCVSMTNLISYKKRSKDCCCCWALCFMNESAHSATFCVDLSLVVHGERRTYSKRFILSKHIYIYMNNKDI